MPTEYIWFIRAILLGLLALLLLFRFAAKHAIKGAGKHVFLSTMVSSILLASSLFCLVGGVVRSPGWLTTAEDCSESLSDKVNESLSEGLTQTSKGRYSDGIRSYAHAHKHLRQQSALINYLCGTAEMLNGNYKQAFQSFQRMFASDGTYTARLMGSNGSFIAKYYLCALSEVGPTAAMRWLDDVIKDSDRACTPEVRQYAAAFAAGRNGHDSLDEYSLLTKPDRAEIRKFWVEERKLMEKCAAAQISTQEVRRVSSKAPSKSSTE